MARIERHLRRRLANGLRCQDATLLARLDPGTNPSRASICIRVDQSHRGALNHSSILVPLLVLCDTNILLDKLVERLPHVQAIRSTCTGASINPQVLVELQKQAPNLAILVHRIGEHLHQAIHLVVVVSNRKSLHVDFLGDPILGQQALKRNHHNGLELVVALGRRV